MLWYEKQVSHRIDPDRLDFSLRCHAVFSLGDTVRSLHRSSVMVSDSSAYAASLHDPGGFFAAHWSRPLSYPYPVQASVSSLWCQQGRQLWRPGRPALWLSHGCQDCGLSGERTADHTAGSKLSSVIYQSAKPYVFDRVPMYESVLRADSCTAGTVHGISPHRAGTSAGRSDFGRAGILVLRYLPTQYAPALPDTTTPPTLPLSPCWNHP